MKTHEELFNNFSQEVNSADIKKIKDKEIYVLWSGGLDSTALLYCLANKFPDKDIHAVSIVLENAQSCKTDKECREKLKKRFKKEKLNNIYYNESHIDIDTGGGSSYGLGQPVTWLMSLCLMSLTNRNAAICFGYIKGDDIWHYMEYFKKAFHNLNIITGNNTAELYLPLGFVSKYDIIEYMKAQKLFDLCNWCEHADTSNGPCKRCKDCENVEYYELKHKRLVKEKRWNTRTNNITKLITAYESKHNIKVTKENFSKLKIKGIGKKAIEEINKYPFLYLTDEQEKLDSIVKESA